MASTHPYKVALHCTDKEPTEVNNLATNVIAELTLNAASFVTSTMPLTAITALIATLTTANNKLTGYIAGAPGNHTVTTQRNTQTVIVYNMLNTSFRTLVDNVANGNKAIVELSGFDATADAVAHGVPATPVITKISDTKQAAGAAKILLEKHKKKALIGTTPSVTKARLKYSAQTTTAPDSATSVWTNNVESVSSKDLILTGLTKAVEVSVRVRAEDGKFKSPWSKSITYISRTSATPHPTTSPTTGTTTTPPATG